MRERIELAHEAAREVTKKNSERQKRYYDRQRFGSAYKVNDVVWVFNNARKKGVCPKLQCHWKGPFMVVGKIDDVVYRLQQSPKHKPIVCHYDRLKPYVGKDFKIWKVKGDSVTDVAEVGNQKEASVMRTDDDVRGSGVVLGEKLSEPKGEGVPEDETDRQGVSPEVSGDGRPRRTRKKPLRYEA